MSARKLELAILKHKDRNPKTYSNAGSDAGKILAKLETQLMDARINDLLNEEEAEDTLTLSREDMARIPEPPALIPGVLPANSLVLAVGRKSAFKTFTVLSWILSLATGRPWGGYPTRLPGFLMGGEGRVLYLAGEGSGGLLKRVEAWEATHNDGKPVERFGLRTRVVNLYSDNAGIDRLVDEIEDDGIRVVVIDTLRLASGGADGNGSAMGTVMDNAKRLLEATKGGAVIIVAHTESTDKKTRGFSGLEDDADVIWHLTAKDRTVTMENRKMKDQESGKEIKLELHKVILGSNEDGTPRDSLVVVSPDLATMSRRDALLATARTFPHGATKAEILAACEKATGVRVTKSWTYGELDKLHQAGFMGKVGDRFQAIPGTPEMEIIRESSGTR